MERNFLQERVKLLNKYAESSNLNVDDFAVSFFAESVEHDFFPERWEPDDYDDRIHIIDPYECDSCWDDDPPFSLPPTTYYSGFNIKKVPGKIIEVSTRDVSIKNTVLPIRNAIEYLLDGHCVGASVCIEVTIDSNILLCFDMLTHPEGNIGYEKDNLLIIISIYDEYKGLIFDALARKKDVICMFYIRLLSFAKRNLGEFNEFFRECVEPYFMDDIEFINFFPKEEFILSKIKSPAIEKYILSNIDELSPRNKKIALEHLNDSH